MQSSTRTTIVSAVIHAILSTADEIHPDLETERCMIGVIEDTNLDEVGELGRSLRDEAMYLLHQLPLLCLVKWRIELGQAGLALPILQQNKMDLKNKSKCQP